MQTHFHQSVIAMNPSTSEAPAFLLNGDSVAAADKVTVCSRSEAEKILFVDGELGCDEQGNGSWNQPFATLRAALEAANAGETGSVWVAPR
ncbi:MAG: hypothetical protein AAFN78_08660 [Pseudomonadota bacterium]